MGPCHYKSPSVRAERREEHAPLAPSQPGDDLPRRGVEDRNPEVLDGDRQEGTVRAGLDVADPTPLEREALDSLAGRQVPPGEFGGRRHAGEPGPRPVEP